MSLDTASFQGIGVLKEFASRKLASSRLGLRLDQVDWLFPTHDEETSGYLGLRPDRVAGSSLNMMDRYRVI